MGAKFDRTCLPANRCFTQVHHVALESSSQTVRIMKTSEAPRLAPGREVNGLQCISARRLTIISTSKATSIYA
jgi:hypothetical protein